MDRVSFFAVAQHTHELIGHPTGAAGGAVRSYCPLADATKCAFVKVDGMLPHKLVFEVRTFL